MIPIVHKNLPELNSTHCVLRPLGLGQISEEYVKWLNAGIINTYLESRYFTHTLDSVTKYVVECITNGHVLFYGIWSTDRQHIGNIKLGPINPHHGTGDLGFIIGDPSYWGKGIATNAIQLLTSYAFSIWVSKITAGAYENNIGSIKALEKSGFTQEGYLRNHVIHRGKRVGVKIYGLICPQK
jgi:ribosomal-protein-alanine N-acetyltransferase